MDPALSKDRYRRLTEHFQTCVELPADRRQEYVDVLTVEDGELGRELQSLIRQHTLRFEPGAPPPPPVAPPAKTDAPRRLTRRSASFWILLVTAILIVLSLLVGQLWAMARLESAAARLPEHRTGSARVPLWTSFGIALGLLLALGPALYTVSRFDRARKRRTDNLPVGSYILDRRIGRGASADIYLAHHAFLKRPAAVKILNEVNPDAETVRRFEREARLASRLGHWNTIQVFDYGKSADGRLFMAMEYVKGLNLGQLAILDNPLPVARVVHVLKQIAGSMDEAHKLGLMHRDLKPVNIMLSCREGIGDRVKVLDFGIASQVSGADEDMIKSEAVLGTPAFMAPERFWAPLQFDPRSDIYSFGAVAFHLLTGRNVFDGAGASELVYQVLTSSRPSPSRLRGERIPEKLEQLVLDCLSVNPALRPPTFRSVRDQLKKIPLGERWGLEEANRWWSDHRETVTRFLDATS